MKAALRSIPLEVDLESQIAAALNTALSYGQRGDQFMKDVYMRKFEMLHAQRTPETVASMERERGLR